MTALPESLCREFGGDVVRPHDAGYDVVRNSLLAPGSPAYVLRPKTVQDVQAAVRFTTAAGLSLSVRGGGHSFAGLGTNDGGVVIDLRQLADVIVVDEARRLVRIGGGATWGGVADALTPYGLAISAGDTRSVGVAGLTLTGGIGWEVRKHGLALDNVVAADVVIANGEVRHASAHENPELFWAIRGGGGNFGVVTALDFVAHETANVVYGRLSFPASEALDVLLGWADYLNSAPDEVTSVVKLANPVTGGHEAPVEIHVVLAGDDPGLAVETLEPIRRLGTVLHDDVALTAYANTLDEGTAPPPGIEFATRSAFVDPPSVQQILRILADAARTEGSPFIDVRSVGGAVARVPDGETAYAHRRAQLMFATFTGGPHAAVEAAKPTVKALWARLTPHVSGLYANFLSTATDEDVAGVYPRATAQRLAAVKLRFDPQNLFSSNQNIRPEQIQHVAGRSQYV